MTVASPPGRSGRTRRWWRAALALATVSAVLIPAGAAAGAPVGAEPGRPPGVDSRLYELAAQARERDEPLRVLAVLDSGAEPASQFPGSHRQVVARLRQEADRRQAEVAAALPAQAGERARVAGRFWLQNMLLVELDQPADRQLEALARLPAVARLIPNFGVTAVDPVPGPDGSPGSGTLADRTWGIDRIEAHRVHKDLAIDGSGVRVATLDTGVDIAHPDLAGKLVTDDPADPAHPGGWLEFDPAGNPVASRPHDSAAHGTHVSGTIHGGNASGVQIGVAPGAQLMHGLVLPAGTGTFAQVIAGMQWALDPTDANGNPAGRPADVLTMSLGVEGYVDEMITPVRNLERAGIFPAIAIGNRCFLGTPHSPGNVYEAVAVGATDPDDTVADFSCGAEVAGADWADPPADWPERYVKPDLSAPGVDVYSSVPGGGYQRRSGTSMATPHVAGTAALMLQAAPTLTVAQLRDQLADTAYWDDRYGSQRPNRRFGAGRIDAYQAVRLAGVTSGIAGTVTDRDTGAPIRHATVTEAATGLRQVADTEGRYTARLRPGAHTITAQAFGYQPEATELTVAAGTVTDHSPALTPTPVGEVAGRITLAAGERGIPGLAGPGGGIGGITVTLADTPLTTTTEADGGYRISGVPAGSYTVTASAPILAEDSTRPAEVDPGRTTSADFVLAAPAFAVVTGRPEAFFPGTGVANLDAGLLVAGGTRWDHDSDGWIFNETSAGFLWSPTAGMRIFDIPDDSYWTPSRYAPAAVADDQTVAGTTLFTRTRDTMPWRWTPQDGLTPLPLPDNDDPAWRGSAVAVSRDGQVVGGQVARRGFRADLERRAALWSGGALTELPDDQLYAQVSDLDAAGRVAVGTHGPRTLVQHATRWVDGAQQPLEPVGDESAAELTSADGSVTMGTAELADGRKVLVRWDRDGVASVVGPPAGTSLVELTGLSDDGSTAVGSVAGGLGNPQFQDWAPFVWSVRDGFTVLPEVEPTAEYDRSTATAVSDNGRVVTGELRQSVRNPGDPPSLAFMWSRNSGLTLVNDLAAAGGVADPGYYGASAISGDGRWILATGAHLTPCAGSGPCSDTNSIVLWLDACPTGVPADVTVSFEGEDSGVPNYDWGDGCTFLDAVAAAGPYDSHAQFLTTVIKLTRQWRQDRLLSGPEIGSILRAAARSEVGN